MTNEDVKLVAKTIKRANEIHENSWKEKINEDGNRIAQYTIPLIEAYKQAVEEVGLPEPMWGILYLAADWNNDLMEWAEAIEKDKWSELFNPQEEDSLFAS